MFLFAAAIVSVLCCFTFSVLGMYVANQNGRKPVEGLILGGVFGIIGILIAVALPKTGKPPQNLGSLYLTWGFSAAGIMAILWATPYSMYHLW